jgi:subtilisin family serine protease
MSGTSMASPHVAGLAAYLLAYEGKKTPAALSTRIQALALKNKIVVLRTTLLSMATPTVKRITNIPSQAWRCT